MRWTRGTRWACCEQSLVLACCSLCWPGCAAVYKEKASLYDEKIKHFPPGVVCAAGVPTLDPNQLCRLRMNLTRIVMQSRMQSSLRCSTGMLRIKVKCISLVLYQTWGLVGLEWKLKPQSGCTTCMRLSSKRDGSHV